MASLTRWTCPRCVWARESTAPAQGNQSLIRELRPTGPICLWTSSGQNIGVGSCSLLQGLFPTQGSNLGLLHCRLILYQLSYQGYILNDWRRNLVNDAAKSFYFLKELHFYYCFGLTCAPPNSCSVGKEFTCNAGDPAWIPGLGRCPGEGKG